MHKSSERSDDGCVWNEDAPTVVSCAFFRLSEPVVIFNRRLSCIPPYCSDGKDSAMKSNEAKKHKSGFNPNRTCYLTVDRNKNFSEKREEIYICCTRWANVGNCAIDDMRFIMGNEKYLTLYILRLENKRCRKNG